MKRKLTTIIGLLLLIAAVQFIMAPQTSLVGQTYRILFRRGLAADLPTLAAGEPGFTTDTRELYVGSSVGNIRVHGDYITPEMYGAVGDGATDDSTEIQAAVTAAGTSGKAVVFGDKTYLCTTVITLPAADLSIVGQGNATIDTSGTNAIFQQTAHGYRNRFSGLKFTGGGPGIKYNCADEMESHYEYDISHCSFAMDSGIYGLYMVGAREGTISQCYFTTGNGLYRSHSNAAVVRDCVFKHNDYTGIAIYDNGDGVAYSCGLQINACIILGYDEGVNVVETDDLHITGSTIDYNNHNIQILGQDVGSIIGNYLGTVQAAGDVNPALYIGPNSTVRSRNFIVSNNKFVGASTEANYDPISIVDSDYVHVFGNYVAFYTRYGIKYDNCTLLDLSNNYIIPRTSYGTNSIYGTNDSSDNFIAFNHFATHACSVSSARKWMNYGDNEPVGTGPFELDDDDANLEVKVGVGSDTTYYYPYLRLSKSAGSTGSPTDVSAGHFIGGTNYYGWKDSAERFAGGVIGKVKSVGTNIVAGQVDVYCTDSAGNSDIPLSIDADGVTVTGKIGLSSGTGTTYQFAYQADALADDGTVTLPDATSGMVLVSCNAEAGMWLVQSDGTVTKISGSTNTAAADTDANLCVYDGGTGGIVKNRLGATGEIRVVYYYN